MYYVYLVCREEDWQWYVGYTSDLRERLAEHNRGSVSSRPESRFALIYYEAYLHKLDAIRRECFLKSLAGRRFLKEQLMHFLRFKNPTYDLEERQPETSQIPSNTELVTMEGG